MYIIGSVFSIFFLSGITPLIRNSISPILGLSYLSFAVGFLIISNQVVSLLSVFSILVLLWSFLFYYYYVRPLKYEKGYFNELLKSISISNEFLYSIFFYSVISIFFVYMGKSSPGSDSTQFEGIGRFLANGGTIKDEPQYLSFLLNGRLLVVGAMHCLNRLFGGYSLYALNPTIVIWSLVIFSLLYYKELNKFSTKKKYILTGLFLIAMLFCKKFFLQIFFIHSNAFAMIFFSLSIISLYLFARSKIESWLVLGSFLIGSATLIRIDMLIFSLLYFILLPSVVGNKKSILIKCWIIFSLIALPWRLFTLYHTPSSNFYVNSDHIIILILAHFGLVILSLVLQKRSLKLFLNIPLFTMLGVFVLFIISSIYRPSGLQLAWEIFIKYRLLGQDWLLLFSVLLIMLFCVYQIKKLDSNITIFSYSIWLYILFLTLMVTFYSYEEKDHSAGRIMNHIVPLVVYWVFISLSNLLKNKNPELSNI